MSKVKPPLKSVQPSNAVLLAMIQDLKIRVATLEKINEMEKMLNQPMC